MVLLKSLRPNHWIKNLLVFSAPLSSFQFRSEVWIPSIVAFILFCIISSSVYLLNDCIDVEQDRRHPKKRNRPIAKGYLSIKKALLVSFFLAITCLFISYIYSLYLFFTLLTYLILQIFYSFGLKSQPLLDIICISFGFFLRAMAGGIVYSIDRSPWFFLTIWLVALFLAIEKRKTELREYKEEALNTRQVLGRYSLSLLNRLESLASTSTFITYSLWAGGPNLGGAPTSWMLLTVPFVLIGIFRFQLLTDPEETNRRKESQPYMTGETPELIIIKDKGMILTIICWFITIISIAILKY